MANDVHIVNSSMDLSECRDAWTFDRTHSCWCLEDIIYTPAPLTPQFQRMSIFVPAPYMKAPGVIDPVSVINGYTAETVPVVLENNSAGYRQMPHTWIGGPRNYAEQYLEHGLIYVSCGNRGYESVDQNGNYCGRAPANLVDIKMVIRFLRHNRANLPGDYDRIISVGWSAGGAMSSLLGVTGNSHNYDSMLEKAGAFMDERDDVFAAQIYCPIIDLDHADLAYEWVFGADKENEDCVSAPHGFMTPFEEALSKKLSAEYIKYFNALKIKNPDGEGFLTINEDGRSGSGYDYLMNELNKSATKFLIKLEAGELPEKYSVEDYLSGNYTYMARAPRGGPKDRGEAHQAGEGVVLSEDSSLTLGEKMLRPQQNTAPAPAQPGGHGMVEMQGRDKHDWLKWDGEKAEMTNLDDYVLNHRRRMKPCTSFDSLDCVTTENGVLASPDSEGTHFSTYVAGLMEELKDDFPEEYAKYYEGYKSVQGDEGLAERKRLFNPMSYICTGEKSDLAEHFRIRVGASDADTAFTISMVLALKLMEAGKDTDYALVWDKPHSEADYAGEMIAWIDSICGK